MKKLNITKEQFNRSNYFQKKYGKLEYVSESGRLFKTNKGKVLKFNESEGSFFGIPGVVERHDMIIYKNCHIEPSEFWGNLGELYDEEHPEDTNHEGFDNWCWENSDLIESELEHLASYDDDYEGDDYYAESRKKFGKKFNEADEDIPVTEQEKLLCKYIPDEIEEFCAKNGLEVSCYCSEHQTGEEQHIEIYVGIPEGDDPTDPKYDNIEVNLEMLVNGIGDSENDGEKWGDASFQWISDEEIFGELWPIDEQGRGIGRGKYAESKRFGKKFVKESSDGGKARIERLCSNLEKQYDTLTYDEIEGKLKKAGFVLDEYGGKTNAYAVFVHDCGIVVNLEYQFVKDYGTRDSWHAANVTYFGWYDDPEYQRWSNESTKRRFGKKLVKESSFQVLDADEESITLSRECPFCHREHHITLDMSGDDFFDAYNAMVEGELIQHAFPNLSADEREFIKTGICNQCWDEM